MSPLGSHSSIGESSRVDESLSLTVDSRRFARFARRSALVAALSLGSLAWASAVNAQPKDTDWDGGYQTVAKRRSDLTLGLSAGPWLGVARGYPNEVAKIGVPEFEADTGLGFGGSGAAWLGAALRDWFNFGIGGSYGRFEHNGLRASGGGLIFRLEAFPLFSQGGALADLGIGADLGLSVYNIARGSENKAEGGAMSHITVGVFHESWRFGRCAVGPTLEYTHLFSETLTVNTALAGVRLALYTGPG